MGKIVLYGIEPSPPVRAVLLTLKALNLPYTFQVVDLLKGEHLQKNYLQKNPQHTVPTLEDDGNLIWESHAIMAYLVSKYGKDDSLYPKDFLKRAVVDQRMYFEAGMVFEVALRAITVPLFFKNETNVPQQKIDAITTVYEFMEEFLKTTPYAAGTQLTIADFSLISSIVSLEGLLPVDAAKYPKLCAWIKRMEKLPYYEEANGKGAKIIHDMINSKNIKIVN